MHIMTLLRVNTVFIYCALGHSGGVLISVAPGGGHHAPCRLMRAFGGVLLT